MSGTGSAAVDTPKMLALDLSALEKPEGCGCSCACCGGGGHSPWAGPSHDAVEGRLEHLDGLIDAAKALLARAQLALADGATSAAEIRDMQRLEIWLARMVVEKARLRPPNGKKRK
jgi:hypothetical protein